MHTIEQAPFSAIVARRQTAEALQAWCAKTIHRYRLVFVLAGLFYGGLLLLVIAIFSTPY